jgi:MoaA/NifB/PqqE/SkfB family radical SAM enzyme
LITYAEELGQVTGLLTDGNKLGDSAYLHQLLEAGLDHTMIVLQPQEKKTWASLASFSYWAETMDEDLFVAVHLTLTRENVEGRREIISKLASAGISALSLSANSAELAEALKDAQEIAYEHDLELVWDIPVPYSGLNPIALELEESEDDDRSSGAGRGWLYLEPDGDVLPGQGINQVIGNLLTDEWASVWEGASAFKQEG